MVLTKSTIVTWAVDPFFSQQLNDERWTKLSQMEAEGKTDMSWEELTPYCFKRNWVDLAAAQEYIDFVYESAAKYDPNSIASHQIVDYV